MFCGIFLTITSLQWDPQTLVCLSIFTGHSGIVYEAAWSPHLHNTFASVSGEGERDRESVGKEEGSEGGNGRGKEGVGVCERV